MGWYGHSNSGGCCCHHVSRCTLIADEFDRPDDTDIGADYVEAAGNAAISSETLLVSSNNSQIIGANANPDGPYSYLSVSVKLNSGSATARALLAWADTSNYLYATITTTSITVGRQGGAGGSQTESVTITPGTVYQLTLCYNGTQLIGTINGVQAVKDSLTAPGVKHGVGAGTASVTFDNLLVRKVSVPCSECKSMIVVSACSPCQENEIALEWSMEIAGVTNGTCTDCANANGLWIFTSVGQLGVGSVSCSWNAPTVVEPEICGTPAGLNIAPASFNLVSGEYASAGALQNSIATFNYLLWREDWGTTKVDCDGIDGLSLPLVASLPNCVGGTCVIRRVLP